MAQAPYITGLAGLYKLRIQFNDIYTVFDIGSISELTISTSLIDFLPTIKFKVQCDGGYITHNLPFDKATTITIQYDIPSVDSQGVENTLYNSYKFDIYRRTPAQDLMFECEGLLSSKQVFAPRKSRGWMDTPENVAKKIATEMGFVGDNVLISKNPSKTKKILQPYINNLGMLNWLAQNAIEKSGGGLYYTFVDNYNGFSKFHFKSLFDFTNSEAKYKFLLGGGSPLVGRLPIWEYAIEDNYKLIGLYGFATKDYTYFDYKTGAYKAKKATLSSFKSLTDSYMFTQEDAELPNYNDASMGRSNEFTDDFSEKATHDLYSNVINLSRLTISTKGLPEIHPGDVVDIIFGNPNLQDNINRQYNGKWMVERIDHYFGRIYSNKLVLTRNGLDVKGTALMTENALTSFNKTLK